MRIAIFGSGGVGGYFGAKLARGGNDVAFVARGAHLAERRETGLSVQSAGGDIVLTVDPAQIPVMRAALLSAMKQPGFARLVDAAALRVLIAKSRAGLI